MPGAFSPRLNKSKFEQCYRVMNGYKSISGIHLRYSKILFKLFWMEQYLFIYFFNDGSSEIVILSSLGFIFLKFCIIVSFVFYKESFMLVNWTSHAFILNRLFRVLMIYFFTESFKLCYVCYWSIGLENHVDTRIEGAFSFFLVWEREITISNAGCFTKLLVKYFLRKKKIFLSFLFQKNIFKKNKILNQKQKNNTKHHKL